MTDTAIVQGNAVRSRVVFRDINGDLVDPTAVIHRVRDPAGTETNYTYLVDANVIRDSEGVYLFWIATAALPDDYTSRWIAYDVDGNEIANEVTFTVDATAFTTADPP